MTTTYSYDAEPAVYFVEGAGLVKIGWSRDPQARLATLQLGSPVQLTLRACVHGTLEDEHALHRRFAHLRRHGEWFAFEAELREHVERAAAAERAKADPMGAGLRRARAAWCVATVT